MKNKILIIILLTKGLLSIAFAQQASQAEVINAAINTLMYESDSRHYYCTDSVANIYTKSLNGNVVLYEVKMTNGNSVLLSGHKSCTPVLAVIPAEGVNSGKSLLKDYYDLPDALRSLIDVYAYTVDSCFKKVTTNEYISEWNALQQYNPYYDRNRANTVGPLITSQWGQDETNDNYSGAYNYYMQPSPYCNGRKCVAGCVAVAMAQILRYWSEPQEIPYKCAQYQYQWDDMPNTLIYRNNNNFETQRNAIAALIRDCGTHVNMSYCTTDCSAGAFTSDVPTALENFGYSYAVYRERSDYTSAQWGNMIRSDLDDGMPIQYRGTDSGAGHSFVCDGYKKKVFSSDYLYHFNWGWNGNSDGWYAIDVTGNVNNQMLYATNQAAVFNIYPYNPCWPNLIMECNKTFYNGTHETLITEGVFRNDYYSYILYSGAEVSVDAGDIDLTNGFYAAEGSVFVARIAPCTNSTNNLNGDALTVQNPNSQDSIPTTKSLQKKIETPSGISVYPNPVTGTLHIALLNPEESVKQVLVTNLLGNVVLQQDNLPDGTINTTPLATGMYIARISTADGKTYHAKFVKK